MSARPLALKMLEKRGIPHEPVQFDPTIRDARDVAQLIGHPASSVYKTLVVQPLPEGRPALVMVAADRELDLKALATAVGVKRVRMASHRDAERLTGLQVGGISALALADRRFGVYLDGAARELERIFVSAGRRGWDVGLRVEDLVAVTKALWAEMSTPVGTE